jgi:hypothetical protein
MFTVATKYLVVVQETCTYTKDVVMSNVLESIQFI